MLTRVVTRNQGTTICHGAYLTADQGRKSLRLGNGDVWALTFQDGVVVFWRQGGASEDHRFASNGLVSITSHFDHFVVEAGNVCATIGRRGFSMDLCFGGNNRIGNIHSQDIRSSSNNNNRNRDRARNPGKATKRNSNRRRARGATAAGYQLGGAEYQAGMAQYDAGMAQYEAAMAQLQRGRAASQGQRRANHATATAFDTKQEPNDYKTGIKREDTPNKMYDFAENTLDVPLVKIKKEADNKKGKQDGYAKTEYGIKDEEIRKPDIAFRSRSASGLARGRDEFPFIKQEKSD